jgi:hypothetical protein
MRAVQALYECSRAAGTANQFVVLVTGGNERDGSSRADEAARQLASRYGLPSKAVVSIRGAGSTFGNAIATAEYVRDNPNIVKDIRSVAIVTNDYHMLRAWVIFSSQMFIAATGREPEWPIAGRQQIREILFDGLPSNQEWRPARVKEDREQVTKILQEHFSGAGIEVVPFVVEDILEQHSRNWEAGRRYARRLRNSVWVKRTLLREYEGVMNTISGRRHFI